MKNGKMKALILAAGNGTRMQPVTQGRHKSLMSLLGLKIIERVVLGAKEAGINEFVVVTGYKGRDLRKFLGTGEKYNVSISYVHNNNWEKANGISALLAREHFNENFVLLMSDHVFDPKTLLKIKRLKLNNNECALAIDKNLDGVLDVDDTTKALVKGNKIINLNKDLKDYNAYDTGMFICSPNIFKVLKKTTTSGKNSLSDGMRVIAKEGNLRCFDNKSNFWADCDTWDDIKFARKKLIYTLAKNEDGIVSKRFNRKVSTFVSKYLVDTSITPNAISFIILFMALPTSLLLASGTYPWLIFGGLLIQLMSILDGVDGEIARMRFAGSSWGGFLDANLDKYVDTAVVIGMTLGYLKITGNFWIIPISLLLIFGFGLDGYMPNKFQIITGERLEFGIMKVVNIKRDARLLILAIGSILNLILLSFILLVVVYHLKVLIRLVSARRINNELNISN